MELEKIQLKRVRVECESINARAEVQSAESRQAGQENEGALTKIPKISGFADGKNGSCTRSRKTQSEWTPSRMDTIPNGHHPEWTPSRMDTIPKGYNPE